MNKVLETTKHVIEKSRHVKINRNAIRKIRSQFTIEDIKTWTDVAPFTYTKLKDIDELRFVFVFNALNFSYWGNPKWTIEYQNQKLDGAWAMIASLRRTVTEEIPLLNAPYLETITEIELSHILRGKPQISLFKERLNILHEIGYILNQKYDGSFVNVVRSTNRDALSLLNTITVDFPSYHDSDVYNGQGIFFHKGAQLAICDIYRTFEGKGFGELYNIDKLTAFADYKIPQVLRKLGILEYSVSLAKMIDNKKEIQQGSNEEIEIRASQIWAIEYMKEMLRLEIPRITSMDIDSWLWIQGQNKSSSDKPYHLTRTIYY